MLTGKTVKIRFRRNFKEQRLWVFIGRVVGFDNCWVLVEGRGIIFTVGQMDPIDVDEESREMMIPHSNIAHIRILPDDFDIENIECYRGKTRWYIKVDNAPDASLGEIGETA